MDELSDNNHKKLWQEYSNYLSIPDGYIRYLTQSNEEIEKQRNRNIYNLDICVIEGISMLSPHRHYTFDEFVKMWKEDHPKYFKILKHI